MSRIISTKLYERLLNAEKSLNELSSVDETLKTILEEATELGEAEGGSLLLYNPDEDHLVFYLVVGPQAKKLKGRTVRMDEGIVGHVARTRKVEIVNNAYKDSRFTNRFDTMLDHRTESLIAAPILHNDQLLGVLELVNRKDGKAFQPEFLSILKEFSERASFALATAMKFKEARMDTDRWKMLYEMTSGEDRLKSPLDRIVGNSVTIQRVKTEIRQVAGTPSTVMIRGETGTGKELVAHAIHELSARKDQPFVRLNCGALPRNLIESELFGHEKGAFTGATERRLGRFELAHGGTLFLDEIGDLPMGLQTKLLRVLQENEFERVGGSETLKVDVRVITATHINLETAIGEKTFRSDLYYRINIFPIYLPPLRERKEDIPFLAQAFLQKHNRRLHHSVKGFTDEVNQKFLAYDWPGNVRELETVVERAIISCHGNVIQLVNFPSASEEKSGKSSSQSKSTSSPESELAPKTLVEGVQAYKKRMILRALELTHGNQRAAAKQLGLAPSNLSRMLRQLHIKSLTKFSV